MTPTEQGSFLNLRWWWYLSPNAELPCHGTHESTVIKEIHWALFPIYLKHTLTHFYMYAFYNIWNKTQTQSTLSNNICNIHWHICELIFNASIISCNDRPIPTNTRLRLGFIVTVHWSDQTCESVVINKISTHAQDNKPLWPCGTKLLTQHCLKEFSWCSTLGTSRPLFRIMPCFQKVKTAMWHFSLFGLGLKSGAFDFVIRRLTSVRGPPRLWMALSGSFTCWFHVCEYTMRNQHWSHRWSVHGRIKPSVTAL